jgi:hypothetical protein
MNNLKKELEKKYEATFQEVEGGFIVPGLLSVLCEEKESVLEERVKVFEKLATDVWGNTKMYLALDDSWIESQKDSAKAFLKIQKQLAQHIKKEPTPEVYESGHYDGFHYIVLNDFFTESCSK